MVDMFFKLFKSWLLEIHILKPEIKIKKNLFLNLNNFLEN